MAIEEFGLVVVDHLPYCPSGQSNGSSGSRGGGGGAVEGCRTNDSDVGEIPVGNADIHYRICCFSQLQCTSLSLTSFSPCLILQTQM